MDEAYLLHSRHTILIAEDQTDTRSILQGVLERDGFDVVLARDAGQVTALLEQQLPCLLLLDLGVVESDGLEMCRQLKRDPRTAPLPIALLASRGRVIAPEQVIAVGAVDLIKKPFDPDEIRVRVRSQILAHEGKIAMERLRRRLTLISASAKDAIIILNNHGRILHWNDAAETIFGYAFGEALGADLHTLIVPERFRPAQAAAFPRFRTTGEGTAVGRTMELTAVRKSGEEFPVELSLTSVKLDGAWCAVGIVRDITERKRAESSLVESEQRFRSLFEVSRDALMTVEPPAWKFTSANRATLDLFGAKNLTELLACAPGDLSPERQPDGRSSKEAVAEMIEAAMRHGFQLFDWTHRRLNGEEFPATVLLSVVEQRGKRFLQATVRDVTESRKIEREREVQHARRHGINLLLQELLAPALLGHKLRSITEGIVRLFEADFCRVWMIQPGDLCANGCVHSGVREGADACRDSDHCLHLVASAGRYTHTDGVKHGRVPFGCYKIGRIASGEEHRFLTNEVTADPWINDKEWARGLGLVSFAGYRLQVPGGRTLGVLALFARHPILPDEDAMLDGLSSTAALVIQQAAGEAALRTSDERFRTVFAGVQEGILLADGVTRRIVMVNKAMCDMLARPEAELLLLEIDQLHPEADRAALDARLGRLLRGEQVPVTEVPTLRNDGSIFFADVTATPIILDGRRLLMETFRDVTQRREIQAELAFARKLEAVGQLAAGIAHEINTPTQYVGDNVHFLKSAFEGHRRILEEYGRAVEALEAAGGHETLVGAIRQREEEIDLGYLAENVPGGFECCEEGISRITSIVRAMKEFAHPDAAEKQGADLNRALANTLTIARNEYKYVAELETDFGELPPVACHVGELNQVFLNLIVNAAQAIGEVVGSSGEKGLIRVRTRQDGDGVRIDITDNGAGIPEALRHRIFEPFFTTKEVGKGSGQGLAIARSVIIGKHRGSLAFESEVGKGTTFTVRIPVDDRDAVAGESPASSEPPAEAVSPSPLHQ